MAVYTPPGDFLPTLTGDGSLTLRSATLAEQYHSRHGAVEEAMHVYIHAGLHAVQKRLIDLLEVGLGTGLNALLTWMEAERLGITVNYHALEPHPVPQELLVVIDHPGHAGAAERMDGYMSLMNAAEGAGQAGDCFRFSVSRQHAQDLSMNEAFDLVYFDAFGPRVQPEMWTEEIFTRLFNAMRPGGMLVTYCAKGEVRRAMKRAGFVAQRLQGPPGKTHMIRAVRP